MPRYSKLEKAQQDAARKQAEGERIVRERFPGRSPEYVVAELWEQLARANTRLHEATFREDMGR